MTVTVPAGFRASGVTAGLKPSGKSDIALVVNDGPLTTGAAVFTSNRCKANPVLWSEQAIADGSARAVVLNSGGANCYTGPEGFANTHRSAESVAGALDLGAVDVIVCSTGVIGEQLATDKLLAGIDSACAQLDADGGADAARAIMTTDTRPKESVRYGDGWSIGGMAKGAGMLAPALATMLVVVTTDAAVDSATADRALREATRVTFDRLDSDGCMSTNDTVLLMASGASGVTPAYDDFAASLREVCAELSRALISDAEGAEHEIAIEVRNAATEEDALVVARSIARNDLFKCAIYGNDPYWGRVIAAVGTTPAVFDPDKLDIAFNGVWLCRDSVGVPGATVDLSGRMVDVTVDLKSGPAEATILTTDLTHAYVTENSAYTT